ncbi:MAG: hypothetical protein Q4E54_08170 [Lachnospiraceae bacterium]|nr:hypothetical protein [Lachnospiraceae bacterium]
MEKLLSRLFDYQRFEGNDRLAEMIEETEAKFGTDLTVEDLEQVSAAGSGMIRSGYGLTKISYKPDEC